MTPDKAFTEFAKAELRNASFGSDAHGEFISGTIHNDSQKQYEDGETFRTSYILKEMYSNVYLDRTGVTYYVTNWKLQIPKN